MLIALLPQCPYFTISCAVRQFENDNGYYVAKSSSDGQYRAYGVYYSWTQKLCVWVTFETEQEQSALNGFLLDRSLTRALLI